MRNWLSKLFSPAKEAEAEAAPAAAGEVSQVAAEGGAGTSFKEQGDRHLCDGALAQAVDCYRRALVAAPHDANLLCSLGFALKEQGLFAEAMTALTQALAIDPALADAQYFLGSLYQASGDADLAATHFRHALALAPAFEFAYRDLYFLLFQQGRLDEATQLALQGVAHIPESADLHFYLGNLYHAQQRPDAAVASFRRSLTIQPARPDVLANLGHVLLAQGLVEQAVEAFNNALALAPAAGDAYNNLGNALHRLGRFEEAVACYEKGLGVDPQSANLHCNLGLALSALERLDQAIGHYRRAIEIEPNHADAFNNLGNALRSLGKFEEAATSYQHSLEINPDYAEAHFNLACLLQDMGHTDDALAHFRRAIEIRPDFIEARCSLGNALMNIGQLDGAVAIYRQLLESNSGIAEAHCNLGNALLELGLPGEAVASYKRALTIDPNLAAVHNNLGNALADLGMFDEAVESYRHALDIAPDFATARSSLLFALNFTPDQPADMLLAEAKRFGGMVARLARPYTHWPNKPDPTRCLRVGLASGDLCNHPVGFFIENVIAAIASDAPGRLQFIAYSHRSHPDAVMDRIKSFCHAWRSTVGLSDENVARQIHDDGIDILIDLSGHTARNRLPVLAWKPAPIQVSWLGYFPTTGISEVDYLIADHWVPPQAAEACFTEKIQRMPETYICFTPPNADLQVGTLPALTERHITFGSFNNLLKLNDQVVALWARVLHAVPDSRLFLKTRQLTPSDAKQRTLDRFAMHGIGAARLIMEGQSPRNELLAAYRKVDIALDPFPFPGGTTSVECLWMGVPVLTLVGDCYLSHIGESILQNAGLPDWIAFDPDEYVSKAVSHAANLQQLATLRNELRSRVLASPLFDAPRFALNFEATLREMWMKWCVDRR